MKKDNKYNQRIGEEKLNKQGCLMKIVEYNNAIDIVVEFQDEYKIKVHTTYNHFKNGGVKNPYCPSVFGVGIVGIKYPVKINGKTTKEYMVWSGILDRCFIDHSGDVRTRTYQDAVCCDEWIYYENFYEWLHKQDNFDKWYNNEKWHIDKDILVKGNKIYSPETCCLVPDNVNTLLIKCDNSRGKYPLGVNYNIAVKKYSARMSKHNEKTKYREHIGYYDTPEQAFKAYKKRKESYIKQVAQDEYDKGNITKPCYEAMMKYEVEITD